MVSHVYMYDKTSGICLNLKLINDRLLFPESYLINQNNVHKIQDCNKNQGYDLRSNLELQSVPKVKQAKIIKNFISNITS